MKLVYSFPGAHDASLSEVGGKARSLILSEKNGFPVPPGFVLSTEFFQPWITQLKTSNSWSHLQSVSQEQESAAWQALKESSKDLMFDAEHKEMLFNAFASIPGSENPAFQVAVRSSAPEEDLEGASFAGGYLSIMGVTKSNLESSVRDAFASCLDYRVFVYKKMRGFDPYDPKIAIVVQKQIASEVSGVGFSINPLTNDYDEAVINSNWGLGETVVAGLSTPDTFVVDKVSMATIQSTLGSKATSLWLGTAGEVIAKENFKTDDFSLTPAQVAEVAELIKQVETYFLKPIDIEWSFAQNELHLLQARPITAYVPVPPNMVTTPRQQRQLYLDVTISVQGIGKPLSVMGTEFFKLLVSSVVRRFMGEAGLNSFFRRVVTIQNGRFYLNLSTLMGIFGKKRVAEIVSNVDSLAAASIRALDESKYIDSRAHVSADSYIFALLNVPKLLPLAISLSLWIDPEKAHEKSQEAFAGYLKDMESLPAESMPLQAFVDAAVSRTVELIPRYSASLFIASKLAQRAIEHNFPFEPLIEQLDKGLPHNMTVQMGLDLYSLASMLPKGISIEEIEQGIRSNTLPQKFLDGWKEFLKTYGHRGPLEIDLASVRYVDDPKMLISQISALTTAPDPLARHLHVRADREASFSALLAKTNGIKKILLKHLYRVLVNLGGYRETHKYFIAFCLWKIKKRVVADAEILRANGRLDSIDQVFDLTLEQVTQGLNDPNLDLRDLASRNRAFPDKLRDVPALPQLFDSRGRVLRPPASKPKPGELIGTPISPGTARGPVKVLHSPDEKPFLSGDILVARATDPGWTPLFASAAAVVLEVGGMLQHGALVAREYGLPCVAGIADATKVLADNTAVEVDGTEGVVRIINPGDTRI